jgi:hypothetical protein
LKPPAPLECPALSVDLVKVLPSYCEFFGLDPLGISAIPTTLLCSRANGVKAGIDHVLTGRVKHARAT